MAAPSAGKGGLMPVVRYVKGVSPAASRYAPTPDVLRTYAGGLEPGPTSSPLSRR